MKILKNASIHEGDTEITYAKLINICLSVAPQGGFSFEEMKKRLKISELLEKEGKTLEFEDADAVEIQKVVAAKKWPVLSKEVVDFCEAVANMEDKKK